MSGIFNGTILFLKKVFLSLKLCILLHLLIYIFNLQNAVQLPIKTHAQKIAETTRLSSQFPVSSGNKHKQKELEWIPVVPESSQTETKTTATTVSKVTETTTAVIPLPAETTDLPIPPPPPPPTPVPIAYPCPPPPPPMEVMPVVTATSMPNILPSTMPMPPIPPPPLPPIVQSTTVYQNFQPMVPSYEMPVPNQQVVFSTISAPAPSTSVFKPPKVLFIFVIEFDFSFLFLIYIFFTLQ